MFRPRALACPLLISISDTNSFRYLFSTCRKGMFTEMWYLSNSSLICPCVMDSSFGPFDGEKKSYNPPAVDVLSNRWLWSLYWGHWSNTWVRSELDVPPTTHRGYKNTFLQCLQDVNRWPDLLWMASWTSNYTSVNGLSTSSNLHWNFEWGF